MSGRVRFVGVALMTLALAEVRLVTLGAQAVTFESTIEGLSSRDPRVRLRSIELLRSAGYPEAASPLAPLITDSEDELQLEAIAAELNFFLAEKVTSRRRVALVVEKRGRVAAEPIFAAGASVLSADRVPVDVALALAAASVDRNPRVAVEALYAFGSLAGEVRTSDRARVLRESAPTLAGLLGSQDQVIRLAALRVIGRVYRLRPGDAAVDEVLGDAVIGALNDREEPVRETAMWALGMLRYPRSVQALGELFTFYRKGPLAERALDALARVGVDAGVPLMIEQLNSRDLTYKLIAIEGVARAGDSSQAATVQTMVRRERNEAILLAGHFANVLLSGGSADAIVSALMRGELNTQAAMYLQELMPGRVAALAPHARHADSRVRLAMAEALAGSGDQAALPILEAMAADRDAGVALAAKRGVARLTDAAPLS